MDSCRPWFFRQLNEQDAEGAVAMYQALTLIEVSADKSQKVLAGTKMIKEAIMARMTLFVQEARMGGAPHQITVRNYFFQVTRDSRFS